MDEITTTPNSVTVNAPGHGHIAIRMTNRKCFVWPPNHLGEPIGSTFWTKEGLRRNFQNGYAIASTDGAQFGTH